MVRVEFHCHTIYSHDSLLKIEDLVSTARQKQLDRVVITDHNTIEGALAAQKLDQQLFIIGEEIMTQEGELLAAFVTEEIPAGLPAEEAIVRLRDQGAFISVSHPFDRMRKGHWDLEALTRIVPLVDAIETYNARCLFSGYNKRAAVFAQRALLPGTAGSDAHTAMEIGRAVMLLPEFHEASSFKVCLNQVRYQVRLSSPLVHFASRYAVWWKRISGK